MQYKTRRVQAVKRENVDIHQARLSYTSTCTQTHSHQHNKRNVMKWEFHVNIYSFFQYFYFILFILRTGCFRISLNGIKHGLESNWKSKHLQYVKPSPVTNQIEYANQAVNAIDINWIENRSVDFFFIYQIRTFVLTVE